MIYFIRDEATQHIKIGFTPGDGEEENVTVTKFG